MSEEKKGAIRAFVVAALAGVALHYVYEFLPSPVTALVSVRAESVWEHVKLVYLPGLVGSCILAKKFGRLGERMLSLLAGCAAVIGLGWVYCIMLGGRKAFWNIAIYLVGVGLTFWLPAALARWVKGRCRELGLLLAAALGGALILFTWLPPDHILFADLSVVNTWTVIPF